MTGLPWRYHDGGRAVAGYRGDTGDCAVRATAIATGLSYARVYGDLYALAGRSPRLGVKVAVLRRYLASLGWEWTPTMSIGSGCTVHLAVGELPDGPVIARVTRHFVAVVDGVALDTHDPCRDGSRCVYGYYWSPGS